MIDIVDIGSGNVQSLKNILALLKVNSRSVSKPNQFQSNTIILPGVGSAGHYMNKLRNSGLDNSLLEHAREGRRIIGICLGFQLLTKYSEEDGGVDCLGLISGITRKLNVDRSISFSHTGWEPFSTSLNFFKDVGVKPELNLTKKRTLNGRVFYNHEYGVVAGDDFYAIKNIENPKFLEYSSMIVTGNIIGMQFHPEKSQSTGLQLLAMIL